jgi:hypothetical protein
MLCRFARVGLGGEWGGAVLLAIENAPNKRAWYGMFPQLGPIGLLLSGGTFLLLTDTMSSRCFSGLWRIPIASSLLVVVGFISDYNRNARFRKCKK